MLLRYVISVLLLLSVITESTLSYYQDCWLAEITTKEASFSEIDELKESDSSLYFPSRDYHLSPRTSIPAERDVTCFHFSETAPDDACCSVASPPPEIC
ncbi:MAG: hypothetical protein RL013_2489 [Bacteroidota bacterium]|jgi:hypothetical protein